jgi:hypothetical protein
VIQTIDGQRAADTNIGLLLGLQADLIAATRLWATGKPADNVTPLRHQAICLNHRRYADLIPVYHQFAESVDLLGDVDLDLVINELMFTDDLFKSYDPALLDNQDFSAMNAWLSNICTQEISFETSAIHNVNEWRGHLKTAGIFLSYSSGTKGNMSFIPRDPMTFTALRKNSSYYANPNSIIQVDGKTPAYDCLIAGPRGEGMGIQGAAAGLAAMATNSHYLYDHAINEDDVKNATTAKVSAKDEISAVEDAIRFVRSASADKRPVLVFGAPFQLRRLCEQLTKMQTRLHTPSGSTVVTGGGWKSFQGEKIPQRELVAMIDHCFGISAAHFIDTYSTAELNCAMTICAEGRYHIPPLIEPVVLDESLLGEAGATGFGTLGFLDPFSMSFPGYLITGDVGHLGNGKCSCGLHGWYIDGEITRASNQPIKGCGGVLASMTA